MHRQRAKQNRNNKKLKGGSKSEAVANHTGITCPTKYRYFFSTCDPWAEEMQHLHFLSIKEAEVTSQKKNTVMSRSSKHISPNFLSTLTAFAEMQHLYVEHSFCVLPGWTNTVSETKCFLRNLVSCSFCPWSNLQNTTCWHFSYLEENKFSCISVLGSGWTQIMTKVFKDTECSIILTSLGFIHHLGTPNSALEFLWLQRPLWNIQDFLVAVHTKLLEPSDVWAENLNINSYITFIYI